MTAEEWLNCEDPELMLKSLRGKASNRKLRLLASACCRRGESVLVHQPLRRAVETAERYADGQARYSEMGQVAKGVEVFSWSASEAERIVARGVWHLVTMGLWWNLWPVLRTKRTICALLSAERGVGTRFVPLFRCVFGPLPFRTRLVAPLWLTPAVRTLAEGIYEEKAFDRMPILADALQDAGCDNEDVLNHCRDTTQVHVRGCWVLDLVLNKS